MVGFRGVYNVDVDLHDVDLVATDIFCSVFFGDLYFLSSKPTIF